MNSHRVPKFLVLALLLLTFVPACSLSKYSPLRVCTMMGCRGTLVVEMVGDVPDTFTLELTGQAGDTTQVTCTAGQPEPVGSADLIPFATCHEDSVTFFDFVPEEVTIRLTWQGGEATQSFRPDYHLFRPNGPDCPPECKSGQVEFQIP